ncbi:DNA-directed primase/polymerase protein [Macadamia integrifolia]|uniref:DNA-directed primase/polymerase protein n=1 Tax=Macadamia integrifolia TaxID=60698 RepID=UPI001C53063B|nr:DNA-directed primase/polymerase protein [Macadamia integrifolia]
MKPNLKLWFATSHTRSSECSNEKAVFLPTAKSNSRSLICWLFLEFLESLETEHESHKREETKFDSEITARRKCKKMASDHKDDVDRLFACFKCGVSPPQSAIRERKTSSEKLTKASLAQAGISAFSISPSSGLARQRQQNVADLQLSKENIEPIKFSNGKKISPLIFYGSPHGVPAKRPSRLFQLLHEIHDDLAAENDLNTRKKIWATFPRQDEAVKFAKIHTHVHVFSYQDHFNGQRRFLVSTHEEFWQRYKSMDSKFRHHYEVILEGMPCHLYFDLEFNRNSNARKNGDNMVDLLISVILDALFEKYSIRGDREWMVELDSSTGEKFSRHLILRIPKTAFKDNSHAGAFVAEICSRISRARESDKRFDELFVSKDSGTADVQLFVDSAVYSRNRCFRLALSSKAGKNSVLLPTGRFKCKNMSEEEFFMESLICKMDVDCKRFLICKLDLECAKTLRFETELDANFGQNSVASEELTFRGCTSDVPRAYLLGKSPFPTLDLFVESIASIGNVSGRIRSWYWFSEYGLMVYNMLRNRYCERIGRQHKSNHVMYIVDLRRAVYYQKCFDPDCKGYRSPLRPIPSHVIPDSINMLNSQQIEHHGGTMTMMNTHIDQSFGGNDSENLSGNNDESITDSCKKDGWWVEAIRIADNVESVKTKGLSDMVCPVTSFPQKPDDEDYEWWMVVERTASQTENQAFTQLVL